MKKILVSILMGFLLIIGLGARSASALEFGSYAGEVGFRDSQVFLSNGSGPTRVASGICRNAMLELRGDNGLPIFTMLSPCLYGAVQAEGETDFTGQLGVQLIDFQGLSFNIALDSENGSVMYGAGISLIKFNDSFNK